MTIISWVDVTHKASWQRQTSSDVGKPINQVINTFFPNYLQKNIHSARFFNQKWFSLLFWEPIFLDLIADGFCGAFGVPRKILFWFESKMADKRQMNSCTARRRRIPSAFSFLVRTADLTRGGFILRLDLFLFIAGQKVKWTLIWKGCSMPELWFTNSLTTSVVEMRIYSWIWKDFNLNFTFFTLPPIRVCWVPCALLQRWVFGEVRTDQKYPGRAVARMVVVMTTFKIDHFNWLFQC